MATPTTSPLPGEMWHLSMDDLLAPLPERPRLGGAGPFVINLSSSSGPTVVPRSAIAGCEQMNVYQIQRTEDRRQRYRLRVGPFASEDEADAVLEHVREIYPSALTATADSEDFRAIAACEAKRNELRSAATLKQTRAAPEPVAAASPVAAAPTPVAIVAPVIAPGIALPAPAPSPLTDVESTLTLRPMTSLELNDSEGSRWFVIQLALADDVFDPEVVPNLDIFAAYRLYSITGLDQGRIMHALRLGFFADEVAARTVANYVGQFYEKPLIRRVSTAERDRFANQRLEPRKDVGATGRHLAIEITGDRFVRSKKLTSA